MPDNPTNLKSRHYVGETVFGIKFFFIGLDVDPSFHLPFSRDLRDVERIEFIRFIVAEHHLVPECNDLDGSGEKHDGYVLVDETNNRWHNQFPCAMYGGIVNDSDSRIERAYGIFNDAETLICHNEIMSCYTLVDLMCTINDQIRHYSRNDIQEYVKKSGGYTEFSRRLSLLIGLKERIEKQFEQHYQKKLVSKPIREDSPSYVTFVIEDLPNH